MRCTMIVRLVGVASVVASLALAGCGGGGTDGGGEPDFANDTFVATNAGSLSLSVTSGTIPVAQTTNFVVEVKDASGNPVPQIQVSCDTEAGLALIEPNSGNELTDNFGAMSGVVGCEAPGSFQMACRLPIGANKREFASIFCSGAVPAGFGGFSNSGGGSLGGGVDVGDDGEPGGAGTDGIRLTRVDILDSTGAPSTSVDTVQDVCEQDDEETICEAFSDDLVQFTVVNNTNSTIRFSSFTYTVPEATGSGSSSFTSKTLSTDSLEIPSGGGEATFQALFAESVTDSGDSSGCPLAKRFPDSATLLSSVNSGDLGFRTLTFRLRGTNENGDAVTITGTASISFDNFDNC